VLALGALAAPPAAPPPAPAAPASAQPSAPAPADAPRASRAAAVNAETFDTVWAIVRDTHWDPALGGVDWEAVRAELRPRAQAAATPDALRAVLAEMLARLGQSHFAILPGEVLAEAEPEPADSHAPPRPSEAAPPSPDGAAPESGTGDAQSAAEGERPRAPTRARRPAARGGHPGAHLALLPAPDPTAPMEAVVVRVDPDSSAARAGLTPGTVVLSINDHAATRHLPEGGGLARYERAAIVRARGTGEPGSTATWRVRTAAGEERDVVLEYAEDPRPRVPFGNLPPFPVALEWGTVPAALTERDGAAGARIGRIAFSGWFFPVARPFDEAMDALRSADGIVLDLRGNPGGLGGMAMGIAGHFTAAPERLGTMRTREGELNFVTNPRTVSTTGESVAVYTGPVAILVDETTASTSEIFAGGMQHLGRARIFGRRTAGAALPAVLDELPNGDVFLHAIADFRLPSGGALEAEGVRPDLDRVYTRLDYDRDGDPILADAIRWIGAETRRVAADRAPGTPDAPGPQTPTPRTTEHTP
jgi:carboxyl-terminal processing protease